MKKYVVLSLMLGFCAMHGGTEPHASFSSLVSALQQPGATEVKQEAVEEWREKASMLLYTQRNYIPALGKPVLYAAQAWLDLYPASLENGKHLSTEEAGLATSAAFLAQEISVARQALRSNRSE